MEYCLAPLLMADATVMPPLSRPLSSRVSPANGPASARPSGRPQGKLTQLQRVTKLQQLLVRHPGGVTLAEIAAELQVDPRSARRYIRALRGDLRTELEAITEPGGQKRWRVPAVDIPRRISVRRTQAYALLAARPLFEAMRGSTVYEEIDLAAENLIGVARRPGRGPNAGMIAVELEQRFRYVPFAPKDYSARSEDLDNLFHAVADLRPLVLCYPATSGDGLARVTIHPYGLVLYKEAIFAIAHDVATGDIRTFDLEHVRDTRCLEDQRFVLPEDFCVDDYAQGQFGLWRTSGPTIATVIDFDARVARELQSRRFHRSQRFELLADGNLRMHLELGDTRELAAWIMGFGPLAVVREPSALREEIERSLAAALAHYRAAPTRPKEL